LFQSIDDRINEKSHLVLQNTILGVIGVVLFILFLICSKDIRKIFT